MNNSAINYGGAIVFDSILNKIKYGLFQNNIFINNSASVGGAYLFKGFKINNKTNIF